MLHCLAALAFEAQRPVLVPAGPAMAQMQSHAQPVQPRPPGAQEGRSLHRFREDAAGRAHKGLLSQLLAPGAQLGGREILDHRPDPARRLAITLAEHRQRFGMGEVEPAAPGHQEFPPRRRHALEHVHLMPRPRQMLGSEEAGGAGADDGDGLGGGCAHALFLTRPVAARHFLHARRHATEPLRRRLGMTIRGRCGQRSSPLPHTRTDAPLPRSPRI